jgi:hypothetical protein
MRFRVARNASPQLPQYAAALLLGDAVPCGTTHPTVELDHAGFAAVLYLGDVFSLEARNASYGGIHINLRPNYWDICLGQ